MENSNGLERSESINDAINPAEIEHMIDNLNYNTLVLFEHNQQLHDALQNDSYIIDNVGSRLGITRSCEHGAKLSVIIKAKALRLNETSVSQILDALVNVYRSRFKSTDSHALDFVALSQSFSSKVLAFSSLGYNNVSIAGIASLQTNSQKRKRVTSQSYVASVPSRELAIMQEYDQYQDINHDWEHLRSRLYSETSNGPIDFWSFVLDKDPIDGFNRTTLTLYAITHLTLKGEAEYFLDKEQNVKISVSLHQTQTFTDTPKH
ncbi:hypothetical protein BdWA1_001998 [Babesia duncani]|uniref:Uncharacterized protein n=1 Tax=Babesia duncani TaxID=323732 RepID=A0AAD9UPD0_9APIC|nr:hypothetical protein BdWA1_001998 [Babesia duncani]